MRDALNDILASRPFRTSAQCSGLLRYIVEHSLAGEENLLRERVIGSEVFGRRADYEPGEDPVVRLRASEVRKRLAQFYQAEGSDAAVRISIPSGSYRATFAARPELSAHPVPATPSPASPAQASPGQPTTGPASPGRGEPMLEREEQKPLQDRDGTHPGATVAVQPEAVPPAAVSPAVVQPVQPSGTRRWLLWATATGLLLALAATLVLWRAREAGRTEGAAKESPKQVAFWAPLVREHAPILLCVPDATPQELAEGGWPYRVAAVIDGSATSSHRISEADIPLIPFADTMALNKLTYWMGAQGDPFELQRSSQLTFDELRRGPSVLIGAFDNDWSLLLLSRLRFHVAIDAKTGAQWIEDTREPGNLKWRGPGIVPWTASSTDYAIITKVLQADTGRWLVAVGGLGNHGTEAAAELITDRDVSTLLPDAVLQPDRNIQIVVRIKVINGHNSVPQIVGMQSW